jgi:cytochrome b561
MRLRNTAHRFGLVAMALHWAVALLFVAQIMIGIVMTELALTDPWTFSLYQGHKSLGVLIFLLVLMRLLWRFTGDVPPLPATLSLWQRRAAHLTHYALYAALLAAPLLGWIIVSASPYGIPTLLFGVIPLPHIGIVVASPHKALIGSIASWAHWGLAWGVSVLVVSHVAAALTHHFVLKDDVLIRMLPARLGFRSRTPS